MYTYQGDPGMKSGVHANTSANNMNDSNSNSSSETHTKESASHKTRRKTDASDFDVLIHLVKASVGSGMLALPNAFSRSGIVFGVSILLAMAFIAVHCMILLVQSSQYLTKCLGLETLEYGQVTEMAFVNLRWERVNFGCCRVRSVTLGKIGKMVVNAFLVITHFGYGAVYFVFAGNTLFQVCSVYFHVDLRLWILILLVPYILLSWIRDVKTLAPLMALANVCMLLSLAVVLYDVIAHFATQEAAVNCISSANQSASQPISPSSTIICGVKYFPTIATDSFLFFGVAAYTFGGIGVVLPLENTMKTPQHIKSVIYIGMAIVATMYLTTGLLGYLAYGNCVDPNVTLSLHSTEVCLKILYLIVQLLMGYVIYASFAIQLYVPMDFLEAPLMNLLGLKDVTSTRKHLPRDKRLLQTAVENTFRGLVVTLLCGLALIEPSRLGDIISLVGAAASSSLAFTFPAFIHILVFYCGNNQPSHNCNHLQQQEREEDEVNSATSETPPHPKEGSPFHGEGGCGFYSILYIIMDIAITLLGVVGGIVGTYAALNDLLESIIDPFSTCH